MGEREHSRRVFVYLHMTTWSYFVRLCDDISGLQTLSILCWNIFKKIIQYTHWFQNSSEKFAILLYKSWLSWWLLCFVFVLSS